MQCRAVPHALCRTCGAAPPSLPHRPAPAPSFANREDLDFATANDMPPTQRLELQENAEGEIDYPVKCGERRVPSATRRDAWLTLRLGDRASKFLNVSSVTLFFPENFGASQTQVMYIGFKGEGTQVRQGAALAAGLPGRLTLRRFGGRWWSVCTRRGRSRRLTAWGQARRACPENSTDVAMQHHSTHACQQQHTEAWVCIVICSASASASRGSRWVLHTLHSQCSTATRCACACVPGAAPPTLCARCSCAAAVLPIPTKAGCKCVGGACMLGEKDKCWGTCTLGTRARTA